MPPDPRPIPRFIADSSQEGIAHGRFAARLREEFVLACDAIEDLPAGVSVAEEIDWFPERAWGGRVWVPASVRSESEEGRLELFGHVSYVQPPEGEPTDFAAKADFTDVLAEDNPDWKIDLNDDVIGRWRTDGDRGGDVTLVWGLPLVRGAVAATAEIDEEVLDQAAVVKGRFTLVAVDALRGFGEDLYLEVKLWDRQLRELAAESLYEEAEPEAEEEGGGDEGKSED